MRHLTTREQLNKVWHQRGVRISTLRADADGTIQRAAPSLDDRLWAAFEADHADAGAPLELGDQIGRGGVGAVHAAQQRSLKREVAVKILRQARDRPAEAASLLREAWVTAILEHPSILPIHDLVGGPTGPRLVMKRIVGNSWRAVLDDPLLAGRMIEGDPLEWHLRTLIQVCHAVHFAHSREIVHLDLKPDNVMVGSYGEVYVVDWGLAVSVAEAPPPWLPHVSDIADVAGTAAYMAPELAAADRAAIGVRTDVYLLGAVLHELVTGQPRHWGDALADTLVRAYESTPGEYGPEVPSELAAICNRATARDPAARFASVAELRKALEDFLAHRYSRVLSDAATLGAQRLRMAGLNDAEIQQLFTECRFGFQQALHIWPQSQAARDGLQRVLAFMASRAMADGRLNLAAEHLAALPEPSDVLAAELRQLEAVASAEAARLKRVARDADPRQHARSRAKMAVLAGVSWLIWNTLCGALHRNGTWRLDTLQLAAMGLGAFTVFGVALWFVRKTLLQTAVNRTGLALFGSGFVTAIGLWAAGAAVGMDVLMAQALGLFIYVYFVLAVAAVVDWRVAWSLVVVFPAAIAALIVPDYAFELAGLVGFAIGLWLTFIWWRAGEGAAAP